jgi:hypothetical protein
VKRQYASVLLPKSSRADAGARSVGKEQEARNAPARVKIKTVEATPEGQNDDGASYAQRGAIGHPAGGCCWLRAPEQRFKVAGRC